MEWFGIGKNNGLSLHRFQRKVSRILSDLGSNFFITGTGFIFFEIFSLWD